MNKVLSHRPPEVIKDYNGQWWRRFITKHRIVIEFYNEVSEEDVELIKQLLPSPSFPHLSKLLWRAEVRKGALGTFVHVLVWGLNGKRVQQDFVAVLQTQIITTRGGMA